MSTVTVYLEAVGLCGPGLAGWETSQGVLSGRATYAPDATVIAASDLLPPAERRRVGTAVKLALATSHDALLGSAYLARDLPSVFSSSGGDGDNCHLICEALASSDRLISPTRFTNSVHNAPSGYWGIAQKATPASTSICAFDGSFSMGLLEAAAQALSAQIAVLLIAYDTPYPEPLRSARPIAHSLGVALLLAPARTTSTLCALQLRCGRMASTRMTEPSLEALRLNVPAARALPLLQAIAEKRGHAMVTLDMFDNQQLLVEVAV
jgi:Beta-ketoacyl synthase, N-terminal domain